MNTSTICNNNNLLKLYKIYPKIDDFNYLKYQFYIYIYLDPFKPLQKPYVFGIDQKYCSAYELLYVGKASRGAGYRHNQHINNFLIGKEHNHLKVEAFKEIERKMKEAKLKNTPGVPHDWKEYQLNWIVVHKNFSDPKSLLKYEVALIQSIGTRYTKKGPLVNKIEN